MKKILFNILLFAGLVTIIDSCKSGEAYTLKMRMKNGDSFEHQLKMNMNMNMTVMGNKMDMKMGMNSSSRFDVLASSDKEKQMKMTYTDMKMTMNMPGMEGQNAMMDSIMNNSTGHIIGKSVTLILDNKNTITDVQGFDQLMGDSSSLESQQSREIMKNMFTKDQLKSMWGAFFAIYPEKPVRVGDTWNTETEMSFSGMKMKIKYNMTLKGVHDGLADISVDGIIDGKGSMTNAPVQLDMDMKGKQSGNMTIKLEDGYIRGGKYKMDVTANMDVMNQKVPILLTGDYELITK